MDDWRGIAVPGRLGNTREDTKTIYGRPAVVEEPAWRRPMIQGRGGQNGQRFISWVQAW